MLGLPGEFRVEQDAQKFGVWAGLYSMDELTSAVRLGEDKRVGFGRLFA